MLKKLLLATTLSCTMLSAMERDQLQPVESLKAQIIKSFQQGILPTSEAIFDEKMNDIIQRLCEADKETRDYFLAKSYQEDIEGRNDFFDEYINELMALFRQDQRKRLHLIIDRLYKYHPHYDELKMITGLELRYGLTKQHFLNKLSTELERLGLPPHTINKAK